MKTWLQVLILITSLTSMALLSGCATAGKDALPPGGDMTMAQIYEQQTGLSIDQNPRTDVNAVNQAETDKTPKQAARNIAAAANPFNNQVHYVDYTENSNNQIQNLFKPLPNPLIIVYIYPHLATVDGTAAPIPGYSTAFYLYRINQLAMPGEED